MVMLVYVGINRTDMQDAMEGHVEDIVEEIEANQGAESIRRSDFIPSPLNGGCIIGDPNHMISENNDQQLVDEDVKFIS